MLSRLIVKVIKVDRLGKVVAVSIQNAGEYNAIPDSYAWEGSLHGANLNLEPTWGVGTVNVAAQGLYTSKPTTPFVQDIASNTQGSNATFNVQWTGIINQQVFVSDGHTTVYKLNKSSTNLSNFFITVNGQVVSAISATLEYVVIPATPAGANIVITVFNTSRFSIISTDIIRTNGDTEYILTRGSNDTIPTYNSVYVVADGQEVPPPPLNSYIADGFTTEFVIDHIPSDVNYIRVYIDNSLILYTHYNINSNKLEFDYFPAAGSLITIIDLDPNNRLFYVLMSGNRISFSDSINNNTTIQVTTYSQDLMYRPMIETFSGNTSCEYELQGEPSSLSAVTVSVNGVLKRVLWDYAIKKRTINGYDVPDYDVWPYEQGPLKYYIMFSQFSNPGSSDTIVVRYTTGKTEKLPIAFRQFIDSSLYRQSHAIDWNRKTVLLKNIYTYSSNIEVEDYTVLTQPTLSEPGSIWINNEKIDFYEIELKESVDKPKRALLKSLVRGSGGTCKSPELVYNKEYFDGDTQRKYFPTPSGYPVNGLSVFVSGKLQGQGHVSWYVMDGTTISFGIPVTVSSLSCLRVYKSINQTNILQYAIEYHITSNNTITFASILPAGTIIRVEVDLVAGARSQCYLGSVTGLVATTITKPAGWYIVFDDKNIPPYGWKNIKMIEQVTTSNTLVHSAGSVIQDAGTELLIPGGYNWEPSPNGMQYNINPMVRFLLNHPGVPD